VVTAARARQLLDGVHRTGLRHDTGPPPRPAPETGTHFAVLLKPELLATATAADALTGTLRVLRANGTEVRRCALLPARDFAAAGRLLLHYPRLHRVAADGAPALCTAARRELAALTGPAPDGGPDDGPDGGPRGNPAGSAAGPVLGAYEALSHEPDLTPAELEHRCRRAGITKLGPGSYASAVKAGGRVLTVLNGFLPALAASWQRSASAVGILECHSPREVAELRAGLLGDLHPGRAAPDTLRGAAGAVAAQHGISLSEGRNGVHLSAGHLEGMFQVWRYFAAADGRDTGATALGRTLAALGVTPAALAPLATDPGIPDGPGETVSPYGVTENLARAEAVALVRHWTGRAGPGRTDPGGPGGTPAGRGGPRR
jgi:hypothetical protein